MAACTTPFAFFLLKFAGPPTSLLTAASYVCGVGLWSSIAQVVCASAIIVCVVVRFWWLTPISERHFV